MKSKSEPTTYNRKPSKDLRLIVNKINKKSKTPFKVSSAAAGFDIYSADEPKTLSQLKVTPIKTGLRVKIPRGYYGRVAPTSGLALRGLHVLAGVVDSDYRGEIVVVLINLSSTEIQISTGDKIAQLICERILLPELEESPDLPMDDSKRGDRGFGEMTKTSLHTEKGSNNGEITKV